MLLKYLAIGCRDLAASQHALGVFGFSLLHRTPNSATLTNDSTRLVCLKQDQASQHRVSRIAFTSTDELEVVRERLQGAGVPTSPVQEGGCEVVPDTRYLDYPTTLPFLTHRVYEGGEGLSSSSLDHILVCCEKGTARQHAQWFADVLSLQPYRCQVTNQNIFLEILTLTGSLKIIMYQYFFLKKKLYP